MYFNHLIWKIKGVSIATKCHHIYQETNIKLKRSLFARVWALILYSYDRKKQPS
jgi:hypothetical protein